MDIVIVSNQCGFTGNNRVVYLASLLSHEHTVEIVTNDFSHRRKQHRSKCGEEPPADLPFTVTQRHEIGYRKNISFKRFYSHFLWARQIKAYLRDRKKPDVVFCCVPPIPAARTAAKYCKKHQIRFVIDVQDLMPEALEMVFHVPVLSDLAFLPLRLSADSVYRRADAVCAVSETYRDRALRVNPGCQDACAVPLGTELDTFDRNVRQTPAPEKPADEIWLGYCGTLGSSYDLTCVFDAMALCRADGEEKLKLIVMGNGPKKAAFQRYAEEKGLSVWFTDKLPYPEMCSLLAACDIAVNPIVRHSAASIINKHADYAAAGIPVVNTQESAEYRALVERYDMGVNCRNGDAGDVAQALLRLIRDPALRERMGRGARACAEERFDRKKAYAELVEVITKE